jgi:periplasmic protein TonB
MNKLPVHPVPNCNSAPRYQMIDFSLRNRRAQCVSAGFHVAIIVLFVFALASGPATRSLHPFTPVGVGHTLLPYFPPMRAINRPSLGSDGSGGGRDLRPARFGNLAPGSSMPLAPPRLMHNEQAVLPAPPAVFDPNAPASVPVVTNLGLPWMTSDTNSAGRGRGHGFGEGDGDTMGDGSGNGTGDDRGPYTNVVAPVTCIYRPQPGYTEEARKAKLQGRLLLQVLVGADGRTGRVRVLQGLGMGLDESAVAAVRSWKFSPARDAAKRAVPSWVTVETRFQLF